MRSIGGQLHPIIDYQFCVKHRIIPTIDVQGTVHVAFDSQSNFSLIDHMKHLCGTAVEFHCDTAQSIDQLLEYLTKRTDYNTARAVNHKVNSEGAIGRSVEVVQAINDWIESALRLGASDIHVDPREKQLSVRFRLDGQLVTQPTLGAERVPEILSRLKIMGGLDIAEKRLPQDGRIRFELDNRVVDIRLSIIPTDFGEKAVLRLLDKATLKLDLDRLGLSTANVQILREAISLPNGIVLVTGPTGSGKTTTLYAALNYLRSPDVNISTIEDPIEYNLDGINQTQVKPDINLTFAAMLRALLRQDPDIIMVGEIRDRETLDIAIRASLTGHLVLSTVHTNNAVATIPRLLDMGAEPFLLSSALKLIVAQRLVRVNCRNCHTSSIGEDQKIAAERLGVNLGHVNVSGGCDECRHTGFAGRTALVECLRVSDSIKAEIANNSGEQRILEIAESGGFTSMRKEAKRLVSAGMTTPVEAYQELSS